MYISKTMIVRHALSPIHRTSLLRGKYFCGIWYGSVPHKRMFAQKDNPQIFKNVTDEDRNLLEPKSAFSSSWRTFSLTSKLSSPYDKLQAYYMKRDLWRIKRKEFYQKFAAARFVAAAPDSWKPYLQLARVDKPIGTWLLYLPCAFSICLATPYGSLPSFYYLALFGVGAFLMRGAGCTINDMWDRDFDKHVERTKSRPLAVGTLKPRDAIPMLAVQLSLSLGILLSLNTTCIAIGVASMLLVVFYPLAKRVTYFPQAVLGVTFNIGAIMGYIAVAGYPNWEVILPLYVGCFMWTMYYDTMYALQDASDDVEIGIKSTALIYLSSADPKELKKLPVADRLQEMSKSKNNLERSLTVCHSMTMALWIFAFYNAGVGPFGYIMPALYCTNFRPQDHDVSTRQESWNKFMGSKNVGLLVLLGIIAGIALNPPAREKEDPSSSV